ncbi:MAG: nuclear transport factor 2 family protein [Bacteroidetes bacterium]|nr:nuclear transport factor 2 family protein [Bacteroidota bacterium]
MKYKIFSAMNWKHLATCFFIVLFLPVLVSCNDDSKEVIVTKEIGPGSDEKPDKQLKIVDDFYTAITDRDSAGLIQLMAPNARMYGTDPSEDWNLDEIKKYIGEKSRDTTAKAVFTVKKREVRILNEVMYVVDVVDVSTIGVPFRIVTITETKEGKSHIQLAEFSALVWNEDMKSLEAMFKLRKK